MQMGQGGSARRGSGGGWLRGWAGSWRLARRAWALAAVLETGSVLLHYRSRLDLGTGRRRAWSTGEVVADPTGAEKRCLKPMQLSAVRRRGLRTADAPWFLCTDNKGEGFEVAVLWSEGRCARFGE